MAFCSKCGTKMDDGAQFCPSCGTRAATGGDAGGATSASQPKPATEKVGNIRKCPSCGASLESFQARCPTCGHELNTVGSAGSIKQFAETLLQIDEKAAECKKKQEIPKVRLILLGVYAAVSLAMLFLVYDDIGSGTELTVTAVGASLGLGLLAFLMFSGIFGGVKLSAEDEQKKNLIENFPIPNAKEDLFEFLVLATSKIAPAHGITAAAGLQRYWNKTWAMKCRQVQSRAELAFEGDKQSLEKVNTLLGKTEAIVAQAKKRTPIAAAAVAGILLAVVAVVIVPASGVAIKVPGSVSIPAENVIITGSFDGQLKAVGNGISISSNQGGTEIQITVELEALSDLNKIVEQAIAVFKKDMGWTEDNCTVSLTKGHIRGGTYLNLGGFDLSDYLDAAIKLTDKDTKNFVNALLKIETGTIKKISLPVSLGGSTAEKKETAAKLMSMETMEFSIVPWYQVVNNTLKAAEKEFYWDMLVIE